MSEEVRIVITDETANEGAPVSTPKSGSPTTPMAPSDEKGSKRSERNGAIAAGLVAYRALSPFISQAVQFGISQIEINTGSAESQRKAQILSSVAGTAGSIVVAGISGGPYAAAAAAGMAAIQGIASTFYKSMEIQNQKRLESEELALRKSRLGLATNRSRTGGVS